MCVCVDRRRCRERVPPSSRSDWIRKIYADGRRYREITLGIRGSVPSRYIDCFLSRSPHVRPNDNIDCSLPYTTHAADSPLLFHICSRESLSPVSPFLLFRFFVCFPARHFPSSSFFFFFVSVFVR